MKPGRKAGVSWKAEAVTRQFAIERLEAELTRLREENETNRRECESSHVDEQVYDERQAFMLHELLQSLDSDYARAISPADAWSEALIRVGNLREENESLRARYEARVASQAASDRENERVERLTKLLNESRNPNSTGWAAQLDTDRRLNAALAEVEGLRAVLLVIARARGNSYSWLQEYASAALAVQVTEACSYCGGSRYVDVEPPATGLIRCPRCNGTGLADQPTEEVTP